jgi:hypothetical protein
MEGHYYRIKVMTKNKVTFSKRIDRQVAEVMAAHLYNSGDYDYVAVETVDGMIVEEYER